MVAQAGAWIRMPTGLAGKPGQISGVAEDADYTLTSTSELVTFCTAAKDEGDVFKDGDKRNGSCRLQARVRGGGTGWSNLVFSSTVAGPYITPNTVCVHDEPVTSLMYVTTAPSSGIPSGYVASGRQHETANRLDFDVECDEGWTEVHFALGMGSATGSGVTYEFRAKWQNDNTGTLNAEQACTLTSASATTTHSLADTATAVAVTQTRATLTAVQDLGLRDTASPVLVTTSGALTAVQDIDLADTASPISITTTGSLTAVQDIDLADTATPVLVTTSGSLTVVSELSLADTASPVLVTTTGDLTAVQTHDLADTPNFVRVTTSGSLTAVQTHDLADTASPVSVTTTGSLTAVQTHGLADTATAVSVTTSGGLTAVQTHDLADTPNFVLVTNSGIISAISQHSLSGSDSVSVSSSGVLSAVQTHSLGDTARTIDIFATSATIRRFKILNLVFGTASSGSAKVQINAPPTGTAQITSIGILQDNAETITVQALAFTVRNGVVVFLPILTSTPESSFGTTWFLQDNDQAIVVQASSPILVAGQILELSDAAADVTFTGTRAILSAVQDLDLQDTTIPEIVISPSRSIIGSFYVHYLIDQDNAPILVQPLTGFPNGPYISAATHILSVTIDGIGDLDRSTNRGGVLSQRRNLFLKRSEYMAVEDIWNIGLTQLGVGQVTGQVDGTAQAKLIDAVWDDFRQQFISDHAWNGCKTTAVLTALVDSDFQDSTRWSNVFSLPSDYIRALALNGHPNQPKSSEEVQWEIEIVANTAATPVKTRCLVTNQATAKLEYVFDVGDAYIHLLSPAMRHAAGLGLAAFVGANFGKSASEIALIEQKYREALLKAKGIDGQESSGRYFSSTALVDVRYRG